MFANLTLSNQAKILMTAATDLSIKVGNHFRRTIPGSWTERNDATQSGRSTPLSTGLWWGVGAALQLYAQHQEVALNFRGTPKFSLFHSDVPAIDTYFWSTLLRILYHSIPHSPD